MIRLFMEAIMKKRLVYLVILIGILFVGLTSYYFSRNLESGALSIPENEVVMLNTGDDFALPFIHSNPHKDTEVIVKVADEELVRYDGENKKFFANDVKGGATVITISTTNTKLPTFSFSIRVGNGTLQNPYVVKTEVDLARIGKDAKWNLSSSYILENAAVFDLSVLEGNWTPIGNEETPFTGLFDGNLKTIANLNIENGQGGYAGLFGVIAGSGKVEFLKLKDTNITGTYTAVGAVAGLVKGGSVSKTEVWNEKTTISLTNADGIVGGVVGKAEYYEDIKPSLFTVSSKDMILEGAVVGGVLGESAAAVVYDTFAAANTIKTTVAHPIIGGVIGKMFSITNASNVEKNAILKNSYSSSAINAENMNTANVGGVVGQHAGTNHFLIGTYYLTEKGFVKAVGNLTNLSVYTANAITSEQMQEQTTFVSYEGDAIPMNAEEATSWDFDMIWMIIELYPTLNYESESTRPNVYELGDEITSAAQFMSIANHPERDYILAADITLTQNWTPISKFTGTLTSKQNEEGKRFKIKNLVLSEAGSNALFVTLADSGVVSNIDFETVTITGGTKAAVIAIFNHGTISNVNISNVTATGSTILSFGGVAVENYRTIKSVNLEPSNTITLTDASRVGGIVAMNKALVEDVNVSAQIVLSNPNRNITYGGIAAVNQDAKAVIANAGFAVGKLEASSSNIVIAGGIVGNNENGEVKNSYISAHNLVETTNSFSYTGGIAGSHEKGLIQTSYAYGNVSGYHVGGIVGITKARFTQSYFNGDASGRVVGGLSASIKGDFKVTNSYAVGSITGVNGSSLIAGFAPYIENKAVVENCFISLQYSGFGEKWQETKSAVGLVDNPFWKNPAGFIRNSIFNTTSAAGAKDQTRFLLWPPFFREGTNIINGTDINVCLGEIGDWKAFRESASFDTSVWRFVQGFLPELRNLDFGEIDQPSQIIEVEEDMGE